MAENNNIVNLNRERFWLLLKKVLRALRIPLIVIAVLGLLLFGVRMMGEVAASHLNDAVHDVRMLFSKGAGYPYALEAYQTRHIAMIGSDPLVLTRESCTVLDGSADTVQHTQLPCADSRAVIRNGRALIYSNTTGSLLMLSRSRQLLSQDVLSGVATSALSANGSYAVVTAGEKARSTVRVYNRRQVLQFQWDCAEERISSVALSDNGKQLAVLAVGAENAEIYSRLLLFRTDGNAAQLEQRYPGTLMLKVIFTSEGRLIAVGDNQTVALTRKGDKTTILSYTADSLNDIETDDRGDVLLCYDALGGAKATVVRLDAKGKKTCEITTEFAPSGYAVSGAGFALADGSRITVYSAKGAEKRTADAAGEVTQLLSAGRRIYTVENGVIRRY
ncbi:MAG: hypothetical protein IJK64_01420 [Clostridia bacterium]|nr:hypothetical protein [Clostridia bacterium]